MVGARVPLRLTAIVAASCALVGLCAGVALSKTSASPRLAGAAVAVAAVADSAGEWSEAPVKRPHAGAQLKGYDRARAAVDEAVTRGTWTDEDSERLHEALVLLPPEAATEVVQPLLLAINEGHVRLEGRGPLY
jgi:hypothetical protein